MRNSIIVEDLKHCLVCGTSFNIHIHHCIYGSANRKKSEKYGLIVPLCAKHHNMSNEGVHFNKELDIKLKQLAQKRFMEVYPNENFLDIFKRNYL